MSARSARRRRLAAPAACDPTAPFETPPQPLDALNTSADEHNARLSPDESTIYFARNTGAGDGGPRYELFVATRPSAAADFAPPERMTVNRPGSNLAPSVTADGSTLYFMVDHIAWIATRPGNSDAFSAPTPVAGLMPLDDLIVSPAGDVVYFADDEHADADRRLASSHRLDDGGFGPADRLPGLTVVGAVEGNPTPSDDGETIYFSASAPGAPSLWTARRQGGAFAAPAAVTELSEGGSIDLPTWLSPDRCRLYFTSFRRHPPDAGDPGDKDIWVARRRR